MEEGSYEDRLHKPAQDRQTHFKTLCQECRAEMIRTEVSVGCFSPSLAVRLADTVGKIGGWGERIAPQSKRFSDDVVRAECSQ